MLKMKGKQLLTVLVIVVAICSIISYISFTYYASLNPTTINESILGEEWGKHFWNSLGEVNKINEKVQLTVIQPDPEKWGCVAIAQGNPYPPLKKELRIDLDKEQPLIVYFKGKRTSKIHWFTEELRKRANNIGVVLIGDVGLDYYSSDETKPNRLYFDIYFDTNPFTHEVHYQGVYEVSGETSYHSGFSIGQMPFIGKEYEFKARIDRFIRKALRYWNLPYFTIKMVQFYIEGRASKGSMEITKIDLGTP